MAERSIYPDNGRVSTLRRNRNTDMYTGVAERIRRELAEIRESGLYKGERILLSPQGSKIDVGDGEVICLCSNNYLGLSSDRSLMRAAMATIESHGLGLSSVRFICGTQDIHKQLERKVSEFLGTDDTILYSSCFDANGGLFETLMGPEDAIISDALNHASIIDGGHRGQAADISAG